MDVCKTSLMLQNKTPSFTRYGFKNTHFYKVVTFYTHFCYLLTSWGSFCTLWETPLCQKELASCNLHTQVMSQAAEMSTCNNRKHQGQNISYLVTRRELPYWWNRPCFLTFFGNFHMILFLHMPGEIEPMWGEIETNIGKLRTWKNSNFFFGWRGPSVGWGMWGEVCEVGYGRRGTWGEIYVRWDLREVRFTRVT